MMGSSTGFTTLYPNNASLNMKFVPSTTTYSASSTTLENGPHVKTLSSNQLMMTVYDWCSPSVDPVDMTTEVGRDNGEG